MLDSMYFRSPPEVDRAREAFRNIDLSKENGDRFFSEVGPGNVILGGKHMPFERFCDYQELLRIFREDDPDKYRVIHKGTPFLFLAWTAHDMRNFESALFYLDAAIAEDIRDLKKRSGNSAGWMNLPACLVLTLNGAGSLSSLRNLLEVQINRFNRASGHTISVERLCGTSW